MPGLVLGGIGTFILSLIVAYMFLRLRCRGIGPPFGPRARYWASFIVVSTALVSTAVGVLLLAAGRVPAFVGVAVPGGLWLTKVPPQRDRDMRPRTWTSVLTLPFSRLYDRMGDDMQAWCDTRIEAARPKPQWIADAAEYYWNQMGRVTDPRARDNLGGIVIQPFQEPVERAPRLSDLGRTAVCRYGHFVVVVPVAGPASPGPQEQSLCVSAPLG